MIYRIKMVSNVVNVQNLLDIYSDYDLVNYTINKDGLHCLIFEVEL